jgi:hypothetical protein
MVQVLLRRAHARAAHTRVEFQGGCVAVALDGGCAEFVVGVISSGVVSSNAGFALHMPLNLLLRAAHVRVAEQLCSFAQSILRLR